MASLGWHKAPRVVFLAKPNRQPSLCLLQSEEAATQLQGSSVAWPGYLPAVAASHRMRLMAEGGNIPDHRLRRISTPTLLLTSAKDRLLPSLEEGRWLGGATSWAT